MVDADYNPPSQERWDEREARLSRDVDHGPSEARKEIMVLLRQLEVLYGLRLDAGFIEKDQTVVDRVLGLGSQDA